MRQIQVADLTASANEIDNRMGPIPGRSSDRIAQELRWAASEIERLSQAARDARPSSAGTADRADHHIVDDLRKFPREGSMKDWQP